jgi:hypothetical protein
MAGMLEIRCAHKYGIHQFLSVEFIVVAACNYIVLHFLLPFRGAFFPSPAPDIRHGYYIKIQFSVMIHKTGHVCCLMPVGESDHTYPYPVIRTDDAAIAAGRPTHPGNKHRTSRQGSLFYKSPS